MPFSGAFRFFIATILVFAGLTSEAGTVGIFQGVVVQGSSGSGGAYIYVQGKNGGVRRVKINGAKISYANSVPLSQQIKTPLECLAEHPEVKVTAEQAKNGEWKAQEIIIIKLAQSKVTVLLRTA